LVPTEISAVTKGFFNGLFVYWLNKSRRIIGKMRKPRFQFDEVSSSPEGRRYEVLFSWVKENMFLPSILLGKNSAYNMLFPILFNLILLTTSKS
jgi:hypothetical protein